MDEATWLSSNDPAAMLEWLRNTYAAGGGANKGVRVTDRKLRLFACARYVIPYGDFGPNFDKGEGIVRQVETWADGGPKPKLKNKKWHLILEDPWEALRGGIWRLNSVLDVTLLRLIFNPFRPVEYRITCGLCRGRGKMFYQEREDLTPTYLEEPVVVMPSPPLREKACEECHGKGWKIGLPREWLTPDVLSTAQAIYDNRDASGFGPLWDQLETAGCQEEEIRRAMAWEQRCWNCLGKGYFTRQVWEPYHTGIVVPSVGSMVAQEEFCHPCNGTGWLPIPGEPMMVRGFWVVDLLLGKE